MAPSHDTRSIKDQIERCDTGYKRVSKFSFHLSLQVLPGSSGHTHFLVRVHVALWSLVMVGYSSMRLFISRALLRLQRSDGVCQTKSISLFCQALSPWATAPFLPPSSIYPFPEWLRYVHPCVEHLHCLLASVWEQGSAILVLKVHVRGENFILHSPMIAVSGSQFE